MKKLLVICCCLLLLLTACSGRKEPLLQPAEGRYVTDLAEVLTPETEELILSHGNALKGACGGEIAVVTVDFTGDLTKEAYAWQLMKEWSLGDRTHNGCFLLLVIGEGSYYLLPGSGIEDDLTADLTNGILQENLSEAFAAGDYDRGVMNTVNALLNWYCDYYQVTLYQDYQTVSPLEQISELFSGVSIPAWIWAVGAVVLLLIVGKVVSALFSHGK